MRRLRAPRLLWRGFPLVLLLGWTPPAAAETVHLAPDDPAPWGLRNLVAWMRPGYNYGERRLVVETSPPGATVDLFYVRANFQKRYEQTGSPATVILPSRSEAGPRDSVTVRAFMEGHRQKETHVRVRSGVEHVLLELEPLPNMLRAVAHTHFAGRATLSFLTDESLTARFQKGQDGFSVVLTETAKAPTLADSLEKIHSPLIAKVSADQLGEDLMVRVRLNAPDSVELRSRQSRDVIRDLYDFSVDLLPNGGGEDIYTRAHAALARVDAADATGCALQFSDALRSELDAAALSRALAPRGAFTDPFLRAAMKRLGEVSPGGAVTLEDGTRYHTNAPLELAAAMSQASSVRGYLSVLRRLAQGLEQGNAEDETLRSMVAPELSPASFAEILGRAEVRERSCRGGG
jgi:hypothetical protein